MKKMFLLCAMAVLGLGQANAQLDEDEYGFFNHVSLGISAGTDGIGFQVAAPLTYHFAVRAGYSFMPKFSYKKDIKLNNDIAFSRQRVDIEGKLNMGDISVLFDYYPFKSSTFRITAGAYFGKDKPLNVSNAQPFINEYSEIGGMKISNWGTKGLELGSGTETYTAVSDAQGNVQADLKVNSFKPYVGIGFGRAVPKHTIGVQFDLGVQFWGTPEVWTNINDSWGETKYQKVDKDKITNPDKDYKDVKDAIKTIEKIGVYPVLTFRLVGRIL
jgi:hypothetical protein